MSPRDHFFYVHTSQILTNFSIRKGENCLDFCCREAVTVFDMTGNKNQRDRYINYNTLHIGILFHMHNI